MADYLLTDPNFMVGNTKWGEGVIHEAPGTGLLWTNGWIQFYRHPMLALLLNPAFDEIPNPIVWECKPEGRIEDDRGLKAACTKLTCIKQISVPEVTLEKAIEVAIRYTMILCKEELWNQWAKRWLSGENRTRDFAWSTQFTTRYRCAQFACFAVSQKSNNFGYVANSIISVLFHRKVDTNSIITQVFPDYKPDK